MRVAWTLTDLSTGTPEIFTFPINPREFKPPSRTARITTVLTTAPSGGRVFFGGADDVGKGSMSGAVTTAAFKADLDEWAAKWWPLVLTDDRGNEYNILIEKVEWERLHRATNRDRYNYTISFLEVT